MLKEKLAWGAKELVPADAVAAWGARAIVCGPTALDIVHNRVSVAGDDESKLRLGNKLQALKAIQRAEAKIPGGKLDEVIPIYEDDEVGMAGRLAGGYFYLAAWLKG